MQNKANRPSNSCRSEPCPTANHKFHYAEHICTIEDCKSQSRLCCVKCFEQKLHVRDAGYDLYKIYSNTKIDQVIREANSEYCDQYFGFLADYYYEQLVAHYIDLSQQKQEQLQATLKSIKCQKQVLNELTYKTYMEQLVASNISLNEFLNIYRNSLSQTKQAILHGFSSLRNQKLDKYKEEEEFYNYELISKDSNNLAKILEDIVKTKKYHSKQFNIKQQHFIQKSIEDLCRIAPQLGQNIGKLSIKQFKQFKMFNNQINSIDEENQPLQDQDTQIDQDPNNDELYFKKGLLLWENKYINEAVNNIQKAIQINPQSIYFKNLGMIMKIEFNNYEQAIHYYDQAINVDTQDIELYIQKGSTLNALKQFEAEIKVYYDALDIQSHNLNLHYLLGNALLLQQKYDEAIKVCQGAFKLKRVFQEIEQIDWDLEYDENYKQLYKIWAQCLLGKKSFRECIKICIDASNIYKEENFFYKIKGICMLNMNEEEKAIKVFQMVKDRDPRLNVELLQIQGEYYFQQSNFQLAYNFYKTLTKKEPSNINYQTRYHKYDEAIQALNKALSQNPNKEYLVILQERIKNLQLKKQQQNLLNNSHSSYENNNNSNQNQDNQSNIDKLKKRRKNKKKNQSEKDINEEQQNVKNKNKQQFEETPTPDDLVKSKYLKQGKIKKQQNIPVSQFEETYAPKLIQSEYLPNGGINYIQSQLEQTPTPNVLESTFQNQNQYSNIGQFEETPTPVEPSALDSEISNYKQLCQQGTVISYVGAVLLKQNKDSKALEKFEQALQIKPDLYQKTQLKEQIIAKIMGNDKLLEMCDKILQLQGIM